VFIRSKLLPDVLCLDGPESCPSNFLLGSYFRSGASLLVWMRCAEAGGRTGSTLGDLFGVGLLLLWVQLAHGFIVFLCLAAAGVFHFTTAILVLLQRRCS
jgi:hypothetical protein